MINTHRAVPIHYLQLIEGMFIINYNDGEL